MNALRFRCSSSSSSNYKHRLFLKEYGFCEEKKIYIEILRSVAFFFFFFPVHFVNICIHNNTYTPCFLPPSLFFSHTTTTTTPSIHLFQSCTLYSSDVRIC
ncbi:Hypothetical predicted protein [Octopus vulgaris]|uniref:Uncharacterized protein n=1 Tax=Octopus vulgaris TaxID=6645 RepID=A0AA36BIU0_OCTVU|nr:Hypothetical predicted protein [Octopus vulgaris]